MTFKSKIPRRPVKQYEGANPGVPRPAARALIAAFEANAQNIATLERGSADSLPSRPFLKPSAAPRPPRDPAVAHGNAIKASARGEACTVRLEGICTFDPATTIWSHARWGAQLGAAGRGMADKALDVCGAYACTACDAAYDQLTGAKHLTREQIDLDWCKGHFRSLGILSQKGLI